jgi:methyl-accepting chemotaxis protein
MSRTTKARKWRSMTIGRQLGILMAIYAVLAIGGVGAISYVTYRNAVKVRRVVREGDRMTETLFTVVQSVGKLEGTAQELVRQKDPDVIEALMGRSQAMREQAKQQIRVLGPTAGAIDAAVDSLSAANQRSVDALLHGEFAIAQQTLIEQSNPAFEAFLAEVEKYQQQATAQDAAALAEAENGASRQQKIVLGLGLPVLTGFLGAGYWVLRRMVRSLRTTAHELSTASQQTSDASAGIAAASREQAMGASQQAASLEEASAAGEEIHSMAARNGENSHLAAKLVSESKANFDEAERALSEMVNSINEVHTAALGVSKIMKAVDEIAFQTNILALNAAVEAARAGEAGAGFAIVADEVRNLAQRSAQAAQETAQLMSQATSRSAEGQSKVKEVAATIRKLSEAGAKMAALVDAVNTGTQEQERGTAQIARSIADMESVTQKFSAGAQASAEAAAELDRQSSVMGELVGRLNALVGERTPAAV